MATPYYLECLNRELSQRLERNPSYSLRAFAKTLEVSVSSLSRALSMQRTLSVPVAARIAAKLRLSPRERTLFISSIVPKSKSGTLQKNHGEQSGQNDSAIHEVEEDKFRIIADWYHFAILEMTYLKKFDPNPKSIAAKLGITPLAATMAITRLKEAGLLHQLQGKLQKTKKTIWAKNNDGLTNDALMQHQKQCLSKAIDAVSSIPYSDRASSTMTMPINSKKIPLAKRMIEEFAIDLCRTLSSGEVDDVFQLTINFHSLLNKGNNA